MFDLTEPSGTEPVARPASPKTALSDSTSTTSPTRVEVPCPSSRPRLLRGTPAACHARWMARRWPTGLGAVMPLPRPSLDPAMPRSTA